MKRLAMLIGAGAALGHPLGAQAPDTLLKPSARVQMWSVTLGLSPVSGQLESRKGDSLVVRIRHPEAGLTATQVSVVRMRQLDSLRVQMPTGTTARSAGQKGFLLGFAAGGILGAIAGSNALTPPSRDCQQSFEPCDTRAANAVLGFAGFAAGGMLGGLIGGSIGLGVGSARSHRWVAVTIAKQ
jgi:hypothetical protein